ncbi:MAG: sugar transferase [Deltaproteobacteria bacterium]|nr:sugar transferase [Deltaproteobacteria bacterium]
MHSSRDQPGPFSVSRPLPLRAVPNTAVNLNPSASPAPDRLVRTIRPEAPESTARYLIQAILAITALVLLSPILVLVAIAVKLTSPGPLFYSGVRTGRSQKLYTMYKFRTLREGSERQIGGRLLSAQDDFYTPIGKFLKRSKLDEVPQLINVLRGEMNFAGPRPLRPIFLERYLDEIPDYADRFRVAPGMTGLAQVRGGYFTSPRNKLRYDRLYISHRSLRLDAQLVGLTALKVLNRWITLGAFLLVLLLFVSFIPASVMENLYIEMLGARVNPLHGVIAFGALWMILRHAPRDKISLYRTPLNLPIAIFLLLSLASAFLSESPVQAVRGATYYLITGFIVMLAVINGTFTRRFVRSSVTAVALISVAISALGLFEMVVADYIPRDSRALVGLGVSPVGVSSTLGSPIALATYLMLGVPCVLCRLARAQSREARDFWVASTTICLVGILLTRHPGGLVALALIATAYSWRHLSVRWAFASLVVLAPFAYLAVLHAFSDGHLSWQALLCGQSTEACNAIAKMPTRELLLGQGPRTLGELVPLGSHASDAALLQANGNLRLLLENGILGWGAMLWIFGAALYSLYTTQQRTADPGLRATLWAIMFSVLGFLVAMQSFDPFNNIAVQLLFWGLLGIGIGTEVRLGDRPSDYRIALKLGSD